MQEATQRTKELASTNRPAPHCGGGTSQLLVGACGPLGLIPLDGTGGTNPRHRCAVGRSLHPNIHLADVLLARAHLLDQHLQLAVLSPPIAPGTCPPPLRPNESRTGHTLAKSNPAGVSPITFPYPSACDPDWLLEPMLRTQSCTRSGKFGSGSITGTAGRAIGMIDPSRGTDPCRIELIRLLLIATFNSQREIREVPNSWIRISSRSPCFFHRARKHCSASGRGANRSLQSAVKSNPAAGGPSTLPCPHTLGFWNVPELPPVCANCTRSGYSGSETIAGTAGAWFCSNMKSSAWVNMIVVLYYVRPSGAATTKAASFHGHSALPALPASATPAAAPNPSPQPTRVFGNFSHSFQLTLVCEPVTSNELEQATTKTAGKRYTSHPFAMRTRKDGAPEGLWLSTQVSKA